MSIIIGAPLSLLARDFDTTAFIEGKRIKMFVGNDGLAANDFFGIVDQGGEGLFYGTDTLISLMFAAGLWIAADVNGEIRASVAHYYDREPFTQFTPGAYHYNQADSNKFKVYKITTEDLIEPGTDWINWPSEYGAPLDSLGRPLLKGAQTLFAVFNDANPARRDLAGGSIHPLGCEVRMLVYAYAKESYLGDVIFAEYEIENKSNEIWSDVFAGLASDPDVGYSTNDLLGTSETTSLAYCYTEDLDRNLVNVGWPVIGTILLSTQNPGESVHTYTSANQHDYSYAPYLPEITLRLLKGLTSDGQQYIDPITLKPTRFPYGGDPRYNSGWIDRQAGEKRILVSRGPYQVAPGETVKLKFAFLATITSDKNMAFTNFFTLAEKVVDWHKWGSSGVRFSQTSPQGQITSAAFTPAYQNWMMPLAFAGDFAGTGIGEASHLLGSTLPDSQLASIEIYFTPDQKQKVYYYNNSGNGWAYIGYLPMPILAYDLKDQRPLDLIFMTEGGESCNYCFLNPTRDPGRTYRILVTKTLYTESEKPKYVLDNFLGYAARLDLQYLLQFGIRPASLVYNIQDAQKITITYNRESEIPSEQMLQFDSIPVSLSAVSGLVALCKYSWSSNLRVELSNPLDFSARSAQVSIAGQSEKLLGFEFHPHNTGAKSTTVRFYNPDFEEYFDSLILSGTALSWPLDGDINLNGWLELSDVATYLGYLYRDALLPEIEVQLDLDGSGKIDLSDVIALINWLFLTGDAAK